MKPLKSTYLWVAVKMFFGLLLTLQAHAQTYPVQTTLSTSGPYYNYLSYYADQNNHLQAIVTLLDFNSDPIMARLRVRIEGPGYELNTNPNIVVGQPFMLESGVPVFLNDLDLQPYLQASNLLISPQGLDLNQLPEGLTTICVDVIRDGTAQELLSTNNCTSFFLQKFQPPQAFAPMCASQVDTTSGFYTFQWTDPIGYTPTMNSELTYTFSLYRWNDPNNYSIFTTDQGLVWREYNLTSPMCQVNDFDIAFELGGLYVWRVEAQLTSNGMPVNMIVNDGLSEPCTFTYGEPQTLAGMLMDGLYIDLNAEANSERKGRAFWTVIDNTPNQGLSTYDDFLVEYRKQPTGSEDYVIEWFADTVPTFSHFIYQLEPSTTYEVKVYGIAGGQLSDPSQTKTFTTPAARVYACGEADVPFLPTNYTPLLNATAGIQVRIGQFLMDITQLTPEGSAGRYSGKGTIPIAFLFGAKAKVVFDDILIDSEYFVREGRVEVTTSGLDAWLNQQYQQFIDPIYVDGTIDSAYVLNGVAWVVVDGVALDFQFDPVDYPIIVNDESGYSYTIYPNGDVTVDTYLAISETWAAVDADEVVTFAQHSNEVRGFDAKEHMQWHENYEIMQLGDGTFYFVANKSMAQNEADQVDFVLPAQGSGITFKWEDGSPVNSSANSLNIPAVGSTGKKELHAWNGSIKVGQLNVWVYSKKEKEVIVVPIANTNLTAAQIEEELDRTLGEANIDVSVTMTQPWSNADFTSSTNISLPMDVTPMNKYSDEMQALRDAYFADPTNTVENGAYYLFLINGFDDPSELGYMVRGKAMGFIKASQSTILQTISHELGHGMGALEHSWKNNGPEEGTTDNLMDYASAGSATGVSASKNNLIKAQWTELRDWDVVPSVWDETEDGSYGFEQYVNFYQDTKTSTEIASHNKNDAFYLLNGQPYKFQQNGAKRVYRVIFDRLGRVFAFETEDFEYYEAYISRSAGAEVPRCMGYLTSSQKDAFYALSPGSTYMSASQAQYLAVNGYQFGMPTATDSVYSRGCLYLHNGQSGSAFNIEIYESCLVDRTMKVLAVPTKKIAESPALNLPPSFSNNSYTIIEGGSDCNLPANIGTFNLNGYGADIYYELRDDAPDQTNLIALANYFSTLAEYHLYAFYDDQTNAYEYIGPSPDDPNVHHNELNLIPQVFKRENIYSVPEFKAKFPRSTWFYARGLDSVISERDIRATIPEWYNANSIDYTTFDIPSFKDWDEFDYAELGEVVDYIEDLYNSVVTANPSYANNQNMQNTVLWIAEARSNLPLTLSYRLELRHNVIAILNTLGAFDKYAYSLLDLVARESLVQNGGGVFLTAIQNKEQDGMAGPINGSESYTQYVNRFDTESVFFLGFEYMKMYVENFFEPAALLNMIQKAQAIRNAFKSHKASYQKNLDDIFKGMKNSLDEDFINGLIDAQTYIDQGKFIPNVTKIDLMGGKTSQLGGNFANIDIAATKGIKGDVTQIGQFIKPNSIDEIVVSNPFPNAPFSGPNEFYLAEAIGIMKSGSTITINGTLSNKFFEKIKPGSIEQLGFEILEFQVPLKPQFQNINFYQVNGVTPIPTSSMLTTVLRKK